MEEECDRRLRRYGNLLFALPLLGILVCPVATDITDIPKFGQPINNVTVPVAREATLACVVEDLATYKVAWLRVDTQTILTIATHVITKNHRIGVSHSDHRTWYLQIRDVRESDRGWYMCQINTDPMKSQVGYLEVVATSVEGPVFNITRVNRLHMGAYLCIASNGVPPTVSKRIMLIVHFPPMIWIQNQLVGAQEGQQMTLECHSEAYPKSINYWTRGQGEIIAQGGKYEPVLLDNAYKVHMKLTIRAVAPSDFGSYKCVSKNSLGDTDGSIKLYRIPSPSTSPSVAITTQSSMSIDQDKSPNEPHKDRDDPGLYQQETNEIMDMEDSEKITGERGGAADLKLRGRLRGTAKSSSLAFKTSLGSQMFLVFTVTIVRSNIQEIFAV